MRARLGTMPTRININGVITAPEDARIPVLDHGLLFGDSVYETLRTYNGKPFLFSRHFARLEHSAHGIDLKLPWTKSRTLDEIRRTLMAGESRLPLMVTPRLRALAAGKGTRTDPLPPIHLGPL